MMRTSNNSLLPSSLSLEILALDFDLYTPLCALPACCRYGATHYAPIRNNQFFMDETEALGAVSPSKDFLPIRQDKVKNRDLTPFAP
jgi:hypothetical protein